MSTAYEIPLTPSPQTFSASLGGTVYQITLLWNSVGGFWVIDIADQNGGVILQGIPLVANVDLLEQFAYLGFGGKLVVQTDGNPLVDSTLDNLGVNSHVYFVVG